MNPNGVRIGTVGVGRFGITHLRAFKDMERTSNVKLVAAADLDAGKRATITNQHEITAYQDYKEMIKREHLDGISVATPDHCHKDIVLYALCHGLHVLAEKPLDISSSGTRELVSKAEQQGLLLQVDFHKRYDPFHAEIKQLLQENLLGDVLYGYCYMEDKIVVPRDWFSTWASQSSPMWFLGSHFIDLMSWLINAKAVGVYAQGQKKKLVSLGIDTYDAIQSTVTFNNGAVISFHSSWILPEPFPAIVNQGFRLVGTEGIVEIDSENRGAFSCVASKASVTTHNAGFLYPVRKPDRSIGFEGYGIKSIQHFAENVLYLKNGGSLKGIENTYPSGRDAHEVTKVIEAIHNSIQSGTKITLSP
ncbi:MAG: Gfo/Idh/MocA family oxidoreductase [Bacteroidota bacterium]